MGSSGEEEGDFRFNDIEFSDLVLRLEITPALPSKTSEVSNTSEVGATGLKIKKVHINSLMLAYKSQFFYKLFKNGMKETQQRDEVALRINESEEAAFMDLLKFIYDQSVNATSAHDLVELLMAADKFEVPSCVEHCVDLLHKLQMSTELAMVYLELPSSVLADEVVQTLIGSAKSYICAHYRDFTKRSQEEAMSLPLCAVELVIGSDGLKVDSEDVLFDFILNWGRLRYPELEERQEVLTRLLVNSICLPKLSKTKLNEVLDCSDFDSEKVWRPVVDALFSKDQDIPTVKFEYPKRMYNHKAVKVVYLKLAQPCCAVFFDVTKEDIADLFPSKRLYSQEFCLGGQYFRLFGQCLEGRLAFGVYLARTTVSETCTLWYDISVMEKVSKGFRSLQSLGDTVFQMDQACGTPDLFKQPWKELMSEENEYFIDGILHFRVDINFIS